MECATRVLGDDAYDEGLSLLRLSDLLISSWEICSPGRYAQGGRMCGAPHMRLSDSNTGLDVDQ